jgi:hypothetical protein
VLSEITAATEFEGVKLELRSSFPSGQKYRLLHNAERHGWRSPVGTTLDNEDGLTLMYERNGRFVEEMTPAGDYWMLTLPLSTKLQSLGVITFYRHVLEEDFAVDLRNLCSSFQSILSTKLTSFLSEAELVPLAYEVQKEALPQIAGNDLSIS